MFNFLYQIFIQEVEFQTVYRVKRIRRIHVPTVQYMEGLVLSSSRLPYFLQLRYTKVVWLYHP